MVRAVHDVVHDEQQRDGNMDNLRCSLQTCGHELSAHYIDDGGAPMCDECWFVVGREPWHAFSKEPIAKVDWVAMLPTVDGDEQ